MKARQRLDQKRKGALQGAPAARALDVGPSTSRLPKRMPLGLAEGMVLGKVPTALGRADPTRGDWVHLDSPPSPTS